MSAISSSARGASAPRASASAQVLAQLAVRFIGRYRGFHREVQQVTGLDDRAGTEHRFSAVLFHGVKFGADLVGTDPGVGRPPGPSRQVSQLD